MADLSRQSFTFSASGTVGWYRFVAARHAKIKAGVVESRDAGNRPTVRRMRLDL